MYNIQGGTIYGNQHIPMNAEQFLAIYTSLIREKVINSMLTYNGMYVLDRGICAKIHYAEDISP